jgi:hypothetical protein
MTVRDTKGPSMHARDLVEIDGVWQVPPPPTVWDRIHGAINGVSILLTAAIVGWLLTRGIG